MEPLYQLARIDDKLYLHIQDDEPVAYVPLSFDEMISHDTFLVHFRHDELTGIVIFEFNSEDDPHFKTAGFTRVYEVIDEPPEVADPDLKYLYVKER